MDNDLKSNPDLSEAIIAAVQLYLDEEIHGELATETTSNSLCIGAWQLAMRQSYKEAISLIRSNPWKIIQ